MELFLNPALFESCLNFSHTPWQRSPQLSILQNALTWYVLKLRRPSQPNRPAGRTCYPETASTWCKWLRQMFLLWQSILKALVDSHMTLDAALSTGRHETHISVWTPAVGVLVRPLCCLSVDCSSGQTASVVISMQMFSETWTLVI